MKRNQEGNLFVCWWNVIREKESSKWILNQSKYQTRNQTGIKWQTWISGFRLHLTVGLCVVRLEMPDPENDGHRAVFMLVLSCPKADFKSQNISTITRVVVKLPNCGLTTPY